MALKVFICQKALNYFILFQYYSLIIIKMASGSVEVIYGPMFSGKSSELLRKVRRYEHASKKCIVINYYKDNRYAEDSFIATHDKIMHKAVKTESLTKIIAQMCQYDVVAIDEGQFYPEIVEVCQKLANSGKIVIVAALDATFQRKPFGNIINLLPISQIVTKLSAVCVYCFKEASFTLRTVQSSEIQLIGGQQSYKPVCRKCYFKNKSNA